MPSNADRENGIIARSGVYKLGFWERDAAPVPTAVEEETTVPVENETMSEIVYGPACDDQWDEMSEDERAKYLDDNGPGLL